MGRRRQRVQTFSFEGTGEELQDCGDFKVLDDFVADGRSIIFLDSEGKADFAIVHTTFRDRFYNSETGKEVTGTSHNVFEQELPEEVEIWSAGQHYFSTVSGEGLVYMDVGTLKFDEDENVIFEGGHHPALSDASSLSNRERALQVNLCEVLRDP